MRPQILFIKLILNIYFFLLQGTYCEITETIFQELKSAAELSSLAYCIRDHEETIKVREVFESSIRKPENSTITSYFEIISVFDFLNMYKKSGTGFVAISHSSKTIALIFRGTINFDDIATDTDMTQISYAPNINETISCEGCKVHRGFMASLENSRQYSVDYIKKLKEVFPDYKIFVTGHSLGAAVATLAGVELQLSGYEPLVVTIASPKVANPQFANYINSIFNVEHTDALYKNGTLETLNSGIWRIVAKGDIVPMTPPSNYYVHAGIEFQLTGFTPLLQTASMVKYEGIPDKNKDLRIEELFYMVMTTNSFFFHTNYFLPQSGCPQKLLKEMNLSYY